MQRDDVSDTPLELDRYSFGSANATYTCQASQASYQGSTQAIPGLFYFVPQPSRISSIEQG